MTEICKAFSLFDYFYIRKLRNSNKIFFTGNSSYITFIDQIIFYFNRPRHYDIYIIKYNQKKIGYILIKRLKKIWITECIDLKYRGLNIASQALIKVYEKYKSDIYAEILNKNKRSINFHLKEGFVFLKHQKKSKIFLKKYKDKHSSHKSKNLS